MTARRTSAPRKAAERRIPAAPSAASRTSYQRIYEVVRRIPRGRVATYGRIAAAAGLPHAPRVAGYALHALPEGSPIPWHRVVGAGGRLSLARLSPDSATTQRLRLEREGVRFDARGRVNLEASEWGTSDMRASRVSRASMASRAPKKTPRTTRAKRARR